VRSNRLTYSWKHKSSLTVLLFLTVSFSVAQQSDTLSQANIWFNEPFTILPGEAIIVVYQMPEDGYITGVNVPVNDWGTGDQELLISMHKVSYPFRTDTTQYPINVVDSNGWIGGYDLDWNSGQMYIVGSFYSGGGTPSVCNDGIDSIAESVQDPLGWPIGWIPFPTSYYPRFGLIWPEKTIRVTLDTLNNPALVSGGGDNWINTADYGPYLEPIPRLNEGDWIGILIQSTGIGGGDNSSTGFQWIHADSVGLNDTWLGLKFYRECSDDSPTGNSGWHILPWVFNVQLAIENITIDTEHEKNLPTSAHVSQNYPNPFNPTTTIQYELPQRSDVQITIYDLLGREVTTLVSGRQDAGYKSVQWNANDVPSGMYFYQIRTGEYVQTRKMVVLK